MFCSLVLVYAFRLLLIEYNMNLDFLRSVSSESFMPRKTLDLVSIPFVIFHLAVYSFGVLALKSTKTTIAAIIPPSTDSTTIGKFPAYELPPSF
jgi:hypothetical protein